MPICSISSNSFHLHLIACYCYASICMVSWAIFYYSALIIFIGTDLLPGLFFFALYSHQVKSSCLLLHSHTSFLHLGSSHVPSERHFNCLLPTHFNIFPWFGNRYALTLMRGGISSKVRFFFFYHHLWQIRLIKWGWWWRWVTHLYALTELPQAWSDSSGSQARKLPVCKQEGELSAQSHRFWAVCLLQTRFEFRDPLHTNLLSFCHNR